MNGPFSLKIALVEFLPHSLLPLLKHHKLLAFEPYAGPGQEENAGGSAGGTLEISSKGIFDCWYIL